MEDKRYKNLVERFGEGIAVDVMYVTRLTMFLYTATQPSALVECLHVLATTAAEVADVIEASYDFLELD